MSILAFQSSTLHHAVVVPALFALLGRKRERAAGIVADVPVVVRVDHSRIPQVVDVLVRIAPLAREPRREHVKHPSRLAKVQALDRLQNLLVHSVTHRKELPVGEVPDDVRIAAEQRAVRPHEPPACADAGPVVRTADPGAEVLAVEAHRDEVEAGEAEMDAG